MAVNARRRSTESGGAICGSRESVTGISSKSARIVVLVTGVYLICWTPYTLLYLIKVTGHSSPAVELAYHLTYSFANLNYLINPFLYSWRNVVVRTSILRTLQALGLHSKAKVCRSNNTITSITWNPPGKFQGKVKKRYDPRRGNIHSQWNKCFSRETLKISSFRESLSSTTDIVFFR